MAGNLTNAAGIYNYILSLPLSAAYTPPSALKNAYRSLAKARKYYYPDTDASIKSYGIAGLRGSADKFAKLFDLYNARYQQGADAAAEAARSEAMAGRTAAVPKLAQAAAYAHSLDLSGKAAQTKAMLTERQLNEDTARELLSAVLKAADKKDKSLQTAREIKADALDDLYSLQSSSEKSASSGRRSSSGRRRTTAKKKKTKKTPATTAKKGTGKADYDKLSPEEYYHQICYDYPGASGYLMTPAEYARHHNVNTYKDYVKRVLSSDEFGLNL